MPIRYKPFGPLGTNCYLVDVPEGTVIVDPGMDAEAWVVKEAKDPLAILNTHGHFDHVWSNHRLQERLSIPLYIRQEDSFMLQNDPLMRQTPQSHADVEITDDHPVTVGGMAFRFYPVPGHSPGSALIEGEGFLLSGDFIFKGSIGRFDFPFSDATRMRRSLEWFLERAADKAWPEDTPVYPGHGGPTTVGSAVRELGQILAYYF